MTRSCALAINNIFVTYGDGTVIDGLSLDIGEGETFGMIGLNGTGKTTLIKAILGLRKEARGQILIFGKQRNDPESKKKLAYLPERFEPPSFLHGDEFIKFSLNLYGQNYDKDKVYKAAEYIALDPSVLRKKVQTYSKGMRQKLGLLATLLTDCPLLILDEPMSGLDPQARYYVKNILRAAREDGRTIFFCSHILTDMNEICDRVGILNKGHLAFIGKPSDLCKQESTDNLEKAFLNIIDADCRKQVA